MGDCGHIKDIQLWEGGEWKKIDCGGNVVLGGRYGGYEGGLCGRGDRGVGVEGEGQGCGGGGDWGCCLEWRH